MSEMQVRIITTQNGYVVFASRDFDYGNTWSFETMAAMTKALPKIMSSPAEKQPVAALKKGQPA